MAALVAVLLAAIPQEGPVTTRSHASSALDIQVSGQVHLDYFYRDGAVNHGGGLLNGAAALETRSSNAWSGRIALRLDATVEDAVTGTVEIENRRFDEGSHQAFGSDPEEDALTVKQAYIDVAEFIDPGLSFRIGVQDVTYRNRPHDEPFFMDLGESEGFFEGFSPASASVRNTVDRDVQEAVGIKGSYAPAEVILLQALAAVYDEGGASSRDESVYLLAANAKLADGLALWVLGAVVSGGDPDLGQIWTVGAGADAYFGAGKELELFGEVYAQGGTVAEAPRDVDKRAFALYGGARYVGLYGGKLQLEAAASHRSGDKKPGDSTDESFQSYENVNRFLIMDSAEFGLDVDTNVSVVRGSVGLGPFDVAERPLRVIVEVGRFEAARELRDGAGGVLARGEEEWGVETDVEVRWAFNASLVFSIRGAWLAGSDVLEELTRDDDAAMGLFSADLKF